MNGQHLPEGEQGQFEIVFEAPPSPQGTSRYQREDGTTVYGDASGEWTLGDEGEVDIAFFISPRWLLDLQCKDQLEQHAGSRDSEGEAARDSTAHRQDPDSPECE